MSNARTWTTLVAAVLALTLGACDSEESCGPGQTGRPPNCVTPPPPPPVCTQTAVYTNSGGVPSQVLIFDDFPVTDTGRLDLTMDWTNTSSLMGLYLVPAGTCTLSEFNARTCNFLVRSDPPGPKPRRVSVANIAAGNYRFIVANYGTSDESAAVQVVLSKGTCAAVANTSPAASAYLPGSAPTVERAERR